MLSKKDIICPENLLKIAKTKGPAKAVIVNAVKPVSIESAKQAVDANLILPVFIGDKSIIENNAKQLNWIFLNMKLLMNQMKIVLHQLQQNWQVKIKLK